MKFIDFITKNTSKSGGIFRSYYQKSSSSSKISENFSSISHPKLNSHPKPNSRFIFGYSGSGIRQNPQHSIYYSFIRNSCYCSVPSSLKNQKMGVVSWYLSMLNSRPILTKSVSAAVIYIASDLTSQVIFLFLFMNFVLNWLLVRFSKYLLYINSY